MSDRKRLTTLPEDRDMPAEDGQPATVVACVKQRTANSPSCGGRGSVALLAALRRSLDARGLDDVAIQEVQCLGRCTIGPNMRLKGGAFFSGVTESDLEALCDAAKAHRAGGAAPVAAASVPPSARR
jgi:(2Fe-2S) ferredoxin